ncbi:MAG: class I SAM-dependent methyltransferase [Opitutaceae bacterium]
MFKSPKITSATVRDDFNDPVAVVHYARAAHNLGLWKSEKLLIERFFTDKTARLLEAGCGAGRVTLGLWELGYRNLVAFDFAEELVDQARALAEERTAAIPVHHADATQPLCNLLGYTSPVALSQNTTPKKPKCNPIGYTLFDGALFMFNGLMQIPGRANRRLALQNLAAVCRPGAPLLFTTHDRDHSRVERASWKLEALRWADGKQDPRLVEFGDRYFEDDVGRTFMHLPDRTEILEDLAATGWTHTFDSMRRDLARESRSVVDFSDECRFWVAERH